jgi:hypothetical protein
MKIYVQQPAADQCTLMICPQMISYKQRCGHFVDQFHNIK